MDPETTQSAETIISYFINCDFMKFFSIFKLSISEIGAIFCSLLGLRLGFSFLKDAVSKQLLGGAQRLKYINNYNEVLIYECNQENRLF